MGLVKPNILVTGGGGRLARALKAAAPHLPPGIELYALDRARMDITNKRRIVMALEDFRPAVVINAAAFTNVDKAEAERDAALAANTIGPKLLAEVCAEYRAALIHVSTDFVFDGAKDTPYTEDDPPSPLGWYSRTKAAGEEAVTASSVRACIARVAWLCGDEWDFPARMYQIGRARGGVSVATDEVSCPTPLAPLAAQLLKLAMLMKDQRAVPGIVHLVGQPPTSRYDWARTAFEAANALGVETPPLTPGRRADFNLPAQRPGFSALDVTRTEALLGPAPDWRINAGAAIAALAERT